MNMLARIIVVLFLVALAAVSSLYRVYQWEQAILFQFREVKETDIKPGLHFKIPIVNSVMILEDRLLNLDKEAQRFLTFEKPGEPSQEHGHESQRGKTRHQ